MPQTPLEKTMTAQNLHQSAAPALPGTWKLAAGRAITLQPTQHGVLRVAHGCLWATFDGPHEGPVNELGDHFVEVGDTVRIAAGERVVIESWGRRNSAYFTWDPVSATVPVPGFSFADVLQPLADLRAAAGLGALAAARVVTILLRALGDALIPQRHVAARRAFNAHCKA
jgi:hypothetical protein